MPTRTLRSPRAALSGSLVALAAACGGSHAASTSTTATSSSDAATSTSSATGSVSSSGAGGAGATSAASSGGQDAGSDACPPPSVGACTAEAAELCDCDTTSTRRCAADGHGWGACTPIAYGAEFYVAPNGDDTAAGTITAPFATIDHAKAVVQALPRPLPTGGVVVWLRAGVYPRTSTFSLASMDSGASGAPVVYRGYPGETARITGSVAVPASSFQTVTSASPVWSRIDPTAQGQVVSADLGALGITAFGSIATRAASGILELFVDQQRMPLARWPDAPADESTTALGASFDHVATVVSGSKVAFTPDAAGAARLARWSKAPDPWIHGEFGFAWSDSHFAFTLSPATSPTTVTLASAPPYGLTVNVTSATTTPFYVYNLLEELTSPGEWYLDRASGTLYFWPPGSLTQSEILVSVLGAPLVKVNGASWVTFQELTLEANQVGLVDLSSSGTGTNDTLVGCTLRNSGGGAAVTVGGTSNGVDGSHLYGVSADGVSIGGGDRASLTPGSNYVTNSVIHDFGYWDWMYRPAINIFGDGNSATHNLIHDSPHAAVLYSGSQHVISLNEIYATDKSTSDAGAIYAGRDWSARGNVIQNNYIHDIQTWVTPGNGVQAIYLDDCLSGITVTGNLIDHIDGYGLLAGGGRDNVMTNNLIVNAGAALYTDQRCAYVATRMPPTPVDCTTPADSWNMLAKLDAVSYQSTTWASAYPSCAAIPNDCATITASGSHWLLPEGTVYDLNVGFMNTKDLVGDSGSTASFATYTAIDDTDPMFVDPTHPLLGVQASSPLNSLPGFKAIPFTQIGVQ